MHNLPFAKNEGEVANQKAVTFTQFIYMFGEGKGKGRGNKSGGVDYIPTWSSIALTNAEQSILAEDAKEGELNRVIELFCNKPLINDLPAVADFVKDNYGFAGREFVAGIKSWINDKDKKNHFKMFYDLFYKFYQSKITVTDKQAMCASVISVADMLVNHFIFGLELNEAYKQAILLSEKLGAMLKTKAEVDSAGKAYDYVMDWVAQNENHFYIEGDNNNPFLYNIECYGKITNNEVWINSVKLNEVLKNTTFPMNKVNEELAERGLLVKGTEGKYVIKKRINKMNPWCYVFKINV